MISWRRGNNMAMKVTSFWKYFRQHSVIFVIKLGVYFWRSWYCECNGHMFTCDNQNLMINLMIKASHGVTRFSLSGKSKTWCKGFCHFLHNSGRVISLHSGGAAASPQEDSWFLVWVLLCFLSGGYLRQRVILEHMFLVFSLDTKI